MEQILAKLKYHLWRLSRASEFILRPEEKIHKKYTDEMYSKDLIESTTKMLDRIPPCHGTNRCRNSLVRRRHPPRLGKTNRPYYQL